MLSYSGSSNTFYPHPGPSGNQTKSNPSILRKQSSKVTPRETCSSASSQYGSEFLRADLITKQKGSAEGEDTTDETATFNNPPELVDTETDEQFEPPQGLVFEQQIASDSDHPASGCADISEAYSENQASTLLRSSSRRLKRRKITESAINLEPA